MKDRLEKFIDENRDSFDSISPAEADRIWGKIERNGIRKTKGSVYLKYFSRAAAILVIFGLSYVFHDYMDIGRESRIADEKMNNIYEQIPELKEAETYYSNLVSNTMREIKPFLTSNPQISKDINQDLTELDSIYHSLKNDLKDNVANDQIIEAMIQNYRLKLQILEDLKAEIKHEKLSENEKPKVNI